MGRSSGYIAGFVYIATLLLGVLIIEKRVVMKNIPLSHKERKSLGPLHTNHVSKTRLPPTDDTAEFTQCRHRNPLTDVRCQKTALRGRSHCADHGGFVS